jgi:hypothetical protein
MTKEPREYFEDKGELDELKFRMENVPWEPGTDEDREIQSLGLRLAEAERKLHELRAASDSSWHPMREELEAILTGLGDAINQSLAARAGRKV